MSTLPCANCFISASVDEFLTNVAVKERPFTVSLSVLFSIGVSSFSSFSGCSLVSLSPAFPDCPGVFVSGADGVSSEGLQANRVMPAKSRSGNNKILFINKNVGDRKGKSERSSAPDKSEKPMTLDRLLQFTIFFV